jgi:hypothetical protein
MPNGRIALTQSSRDVGQVALTYPEGCAARRAAGLLQCFGSEVGTSVSAFCPSLRYEARLG